MLSCICLLDRLKALKSLFVSCDIQSLPELNQSSLYRKDRMCIMSVQNSFYVPVLWKALWRMYSECYVWLCLCVCVGRQAGRQAGHSIYSHCERLQKDIDETEQAVSQSFHFAS